MQDQQLQAMLSGSLYTCLLKACCGSINNCQTLSLPVGNESRNRRFFCHETFLPNLIDTISMTACTTKKMHACQAATPPSICLALQSYITKFDGIVHLIFLFFISVYMGRTWHGLRFLRALIIVNLSDVLVYIRVINTSSSIRLTKLGSIFVSVVSFKSLLFFTSERATLSISPIQLNQLKLYRPVKVKKCKAYTKNIEMEISAMN